MMKYSLDLEYKAEFSLLGLTTYLPDYRLTWLLNKLFSLGLSRAEDIIIESQAAGISDSLFADVEESERFATYSFLKDDHSEDIQLISNKNNGRCLLKKFRKTDYFLRVDSSECSLSRFVTELLRQEHIQSVVEIELSRLKKDIDIFYTND